MTRSADKYKKMLFIGSGNITSAVAIGLVKSKAMPAECITVYNKNSNKFQKFQQLGIQTSLNLAQSAESADYIFLAVKPNIVEEVMGQLSQIDVELNNKLIVSLAASVTMEFISKSANTDLAIIRTMPSTPITVGEGVLAVTHNELVSPRDFQYFCRIMSSIAHVVAIDEDLMNPIISVQGSSPAYVYLFVKAMLDAAEQQGIDRNVALPLILKTIKGSVTMIEKSSDTLETLISNVASPNGTTLAALNSFEKDDFCGTVARAMDACTKRANEITDSL